MIAPPQNSPPFGPTSFARTAGNWKRITTPLATIAMVSLSLVILYWARPVLIPTALAILFTFLLGPLVVALQRRGVPRVGAVLIVVTTTCLLVGLLTWLFVTQTLQLANELPKYQAKVAARIEELRSTNERSLLSKVQSFADRITEALTKPNRTVPASRTTPPQPVVVVNSERTWLTPMLAAVTPLIEPIASAGLVVSLLVYTLIEREGLRDRLLRLIGPGHIPLTTIALDDAGRRISRYLLVQFMINAAFGIVIGIGLWAIGVPHALLWGIFATFLRYIPIVGPWLAAILPLTLSFLISDGWLQPILLLLLFLTFEILANLIIEPWLYGKTMGVSQSSLLIAIAFWTWLWGPMGLVMAAPLTVCLMIMGRYVPALKFFDVLLGNEPPLSSDLMFYQRLLAHNQDEASQIARDELRTLSLQQVYDRVVMPALTYARQDAEYVRLSAQEAEVVWRLSDEIAEELGFISATAEQATSEPVLDGSPLEPRIRVLACGARDVADEIALGMFERLVVPSICDLEIASTDRLTSEIVSQVEQDHSLVVCIASLPPGGIAHTRLLCKRLRSRFPQLKILVGRWGLQTDVAGERDDLINAGADMVGITLEETTVQLVQLLQFLRPAAKEASEANDQPAPLKVVAASEAGVR